MHVPHTGVVHGIYTDHYPCQVKWLLMSSKDESPKLYIKAATNETYNVYARTSIHKKYRE
jgi:hypothetical protein